MALPDDSVKMGLKEEEIMWMLFREDLRDLQGDAFDGSEEEIKIFQGVFCKNGVDPLSESDNLPGTAESSRAAQCRVVESFGDGYLCSYNIRCILPCSRMVSKDKTGKLLVPTMITSEIEPDGVDQTNQIELVSQDKSPTVPVPTALPLSQAEPDTVYQTNQREVANEASTIPVPTSSPVSQVELKNQSQTQQRKLNSQDKWAAPPFSEIKSDTMIQIDKRKLIPQDDISMVPAPNTCTSPSMEIKLVNQTGVREAAPKGMGGIVHELLPTTPPSSQADLIDEPGTSLCSGTLDISKIENPSLTDLCTHLRAHANRLLADCGYKMELRRRKNYPERFKYFYRLPNDGPAISHLPKTWISLGKLLQSSPFGSALDKTCLLGRQWTNANEFASDLRNTLTYVEKMLKDPDCGLTLSDQWILLDPFIAVACIDRKIGALKEAVPLKAVQSTTSVLEENEMMVLQRNDVTNPRTYSRRRCKKSLLPQLALEPESEKKMDGANQPMVESRIVPTGEMTLSSNKDIVSPITAGEEVPSASDLRKGPCTAEEEVQSATRLYASLVPFGEQIPCNTDFHVMLEKLREVPPITTGEEVQYATQLHASQVTNEVEVLHAADFGVTPATIGEELSCPADLHVNPVTIGEEEVSIERHSCENSVTLADNVPARGTVMVNQISQNIIQRSINPTLEVPFTTVSTVSGYDNIPIGATFTINQVSESMVPQQPVLILYPSDVPFPFDMINSHAQSMTNGMDPPIYQASLFQGTLSFDANSGFQIQEYPITWAVCKPIQSKLKRRHQSTSEMKENEPCKRSKENKEKSRLDTKNETHKRKRQGRNRVCQFHEHDLLISAIISKKSLKYKKFPKKVPKKKPICSKQTVELGQTNVTNKKHFMQGARTVLRLLINTGIVSVNSKIQYRNSTGNKVKEGKLTRYGVLCQCCGETFTMSGFQIHASSELGNPGLNLFLGSGKPYMMCLFKAWSVEYKGRRERMRIRDGDIDRNNDMCRLCGDGGELVCCDSCPSSFHESCLPSQQIPEDYWDCPSCRCGACQKMIGKSSVFSTCTNYLQCSQCDRRFHEKCMKDKNIISSESLPGSWFCGNQCQEVYIYMQSQVGLANYIGDGFYFSILRCDHGQTKISNLENLVQLAENNMKLALALRITEECFFPIVDPRTGLDLIPLVLYNWRVDILGLDYKGFYTVVLEKDERIISMASIRLRGAMVAEMPLVATSIESRKQGMCRRLISAIEEMLKLLKVKTLLLCAIPSLVDTWTSCFGFVPIEDGDKEMLSKLSLIYIPGTVFLKKDLSTISVEPQVGDDCCHTSCENEFYGAGDGEETFLLDE